ncbi:unnamed protein product [Pleuronectes platessa]|uniref:Uncharacterized protein n=1 Tax=Pleuronectes platessa TaxID=8262 RepID=A0A9N7VX99_PLEPL|nr:unnamed protein product [Pleuronectes platessa]
MRPQSPTCLSPHAHDHVPPHGLVSLQAPHCRRHLAQDCLPQVDGGPSIMAGEWGGVGVCWGEGVRAPSANWSGLVWLWSGCLAWLDLAELGISRSPPPASGWCPSICSLVDAHASFHELCDIQARFLFEEHVF